MANIIHSANRANYNHYSTNTTCIAYRNYFCFIKCKAVWNTTKNKLNGNIR